MHKLRLGLVNIMPNAHDYEKTIRRALASEQAAFDLYPIRLRSHAYRSGGDEVDAYPCFDELSAEVALDAILVTGAPVEHLPYEGIHYWGELNDIFAAAQARAIAVMGLCFGGLAVAKYLGIDKRVFSDKLFGVYRAIAAPDAQGYLGHDSGHCHVVLSTWALLDEIQVAQALDGRLKSVIRHPELGHLMLATHDEQFVMMLGHPEYTVDTLHQEWTRDVARAVAYTRSIGADHFQEMARQLGGAVSPLLANWVRKHAALKASAA